MTWQPAAAATDQRVYGAVIGLVIDVIDPVGTGRVRITLPWYSTGYAEWARVAQPYAGDGFGSTWIPEVEGEVLVVFAHGDMRFPYVLGALYSPVDEPPASRTASSDIKMFRTPAGSELSFDETQGIIDLKTPGGASIRLEESAGAITLTATQKIELKAPEITLDASTKVTIQGALVAIN
jgi:uncharacterized protein involved in type VI secretion and phage assembly